VSCPREEKLSFYADGELALDEVRELEAHLVQCRDCRGVVLAVREEGSLLADVLHGRELGSDRAAAPVENARGLVFGAVPALGVAALIVTTAGWLLEQNLPAGTSWLTPIRLMGAYEMIVEAIFMLRDRVPGLLETALTQGSLFAVAAIGTFLVSTLDKRLARSGAALLVALGASASVAPQASAFEVRHGEERVVIAAGETFSETLIVMAEDVRIEGTVDGDLVALAERVRVSGVVTGSVLAISDDVEVSGRVGSTLHVVGGMVRIEGTIGGPLYGLSEDLTLDGPGSVGGDAAVFGERFRMEGRVARDLFFGGDWIEVRGEVGRHLKVRGEEATLLDGARVAGDFDVRLRRGSEPEVEAGAVVGGETTTGVLEWEHEPRRSRWTSGHFYMGNLVALVSAFIVGMLVHVVRPALFQAGVPTTADFFRELGLGFVAIVCTPIAIVVCFATVVGIPLGVITLFTYLTGLFLSMIVVAGLIGQALLRPPPGSRSRFGAALLVGLALLVVLVNLPFVGGLLRIVVLLAGAGMLVSHGVSTWRMRPA